MFEKNFNIEYHEAPSHPSLTTINQNVDPSKAAKLLHDLETEFNKKLLTNIYVGNTEVKINLIVHMDFCSINHIIKAIIMINNRKLETKIIIPPMLSEPHELVKLIAEEITKTIVYEIFINDQEFSKSINQLFSNISHIFK